MSSNINDFKGAFKSGARPNLYKVQIARLGLEFEFLCKAAQLPGATLGIIPVPYMGRQVQVAGDRTFEPWTLTVMNDVDMVARRALETWSAEINGFESNTGQAAVQDYYSDGLVHQIDRTGEIIRTIKCVDIWPSEIAPVELAFDSNDIIEEFTVTFQMNYWESIL